MQDHAPCACLFVVRSGNSWCLLVFSVKSSWVGLSKATAPRVCHWSARSHSGGSAFVGAPGSLEGIILALSITFTPNLEDASKESGDFRRYRLGNSVKRAETARIANL